MAKVTLSFYQKAIDIGTDLIDKKQVLKKIEAVNEHW
jgi:hypothetical protein